MKVIEIVIRAEVDEAKVASLTTKRNRLGNHGPVVAEDELVNAVVQAVQHNMLFNNVSTETLANWATRKVSEVMAGTNPHGTDF